MSENAEQSTALLDGLQREITIRDVLRGMLIGKDDKGKRLSLTKACAQAGITVNTWNKWAEEGHALTPLREMANVVNQVAYDTILPQWHTIIQNLVNVAIGKRPRDTDIQEIKVSEMLKAIQLLQKIIPVQSLEELGTGGQSELSHIESFMPQQINIKLESGDFIYTGSTQEKFGNMPSVQREIEGDAVEILPDP